MCYRTLMLQLFLWVRYLSMQCRFQNFLLPLNPEQSPCASRREGQGECRQFFLFGFPFFNMLVSYSYNRFLQSYSKCVTQLPFSIISSFSYPISPFFGYLAICCACEFTKNSFGATMVRTSETSISKLVKRNSQI